MGEHANVGRIRDAYAAFARADLDGALKDLADDCVFHFNGDGPNSGDHKGRAAIEKAMIANFELTGGTQALDIKGIYADDQHGTVVLHETATRTTVRRSPSTRCTSSPSIPTARSPTSGTCPPTPTRTTSSSTASSRRHAPTGPVGRR